MLKTVKNCHVKSGHSGYDYRVATHSKSYVTTTGITMQSMISLIRQF